MSLLDDVSIVVTPNGYKAGELYAVVPVPSEGAELVTDGGFPTGTTAWTLQANASIGNNELTLNGSSNNVYALQNLYSSGLYNGKTLQFTYEIISNTLVGGGDFRGGGITGGSLFPSANLVLNSTVGTHTVDIVINSTGINSALDIFITAPYTSGSLVIDNVSVKEYTSADMDVTRATAATRVDENGLVNYAEVLGGELVNCVSFDCADPAAVWNEGSGWSFSGGKAIYDGAGGTSGLIQSNVIEVGKQYKVIVEVLSNQGSGSNTIYLGGTVLSTGNLSVGTHTFYGATSNTNVSLYIYGRSGEVFEIGSFSVKEVTRDNVPRIDYTGGGCPHILAEPERTNLITYSSDFSESSWTKLGSATVIADTTISPDGTLNADSFSFTTSTSDKIQQTVTVVASQQYTVSCYIKSDSNITIKMGGAAASTPINVTTEWVRHTVIQTNGAGTTAYPQLTSNGTEGTIYVYGFQLEQGSYPTSIIPTDGGTVTRVQDQYSKTGISNLINSEEGVLFAEMAALSDDLTDRRISLNDGSNANEIIIGYSRFTGNIIGEVFSGGSIQNSNWAANGVTQTNNNKFALSWGGGTMKFYLNGLQTNIETGITSPVGLNNLEFSIGNDTLNMFGKVKQLQVYKTALTDSELIALTT